MMVSVLLDATAPYRPARSSQGLETQYSPFSPGPVGHLGRRL